MKAFSMRCPDCGARLKANNGLTECIYCGTSIMIDDGKDAQSPPRSGEQSIVTSLEVNAPGRGMSAPLVLVVSLLLLAVSILGFVSSTISENDASIQEQESSSTSRASSRAQARTATKTLAPATIRWEAEHPVILPIDSDETADILGYFEGKDDDFYVAAASGVDGSMIWRSESIPGTTGGAEPRVMVGHSTIFAAGKTGELTAFSLRDGGTLWTIRLAEVVKSMHELENTERSALAVRLKDDTHVIVDAARGGLQPSLPEGTEWAPALPALSGWQHNAGARVMQSFGTHRFDEIGVNYVVDADDGSFQLAMGQRRKGTRTPALVRFEGEANDPRGAHEWKELWRTPIAGVAPLAARMPLGFPSFIHASQKYACAAYPGEGARGITPNRMAAFDMADGRRLWDQEIPNQEILTSVTVVDDRVYLVTWNGLRVLDAVSGELHFAIRELALK